MIIAIVGPTASNKSALAEEVSATFNIPIMNFDVYQMYKEVDLGTAKPSKEELESGRYYFYNNIEITEDYDVARYQKDGRELLNKLLKINKHVILVGGNGLYLKALLFDYEFGTEKPMPKDYLHNQTNEELYEKLLKIDKEDALKIGSNNRKRLLRAIYIYEVHGKNKTTLNKNRKDDLLYEDTIFVGMDLDRDYLYERINKRADEMFANGLEEEAKRLIKKYGTSNRALQAIGYKQFGKGLSSEATKELIKKDTRNYAKRQLTFFKNQYKSYINWFNTYEDAKEFLFKELNKND